MGQNRFFTILAQAIKDNSNAIIIHETFNPRSFVFVINSRSF